MDISQLPIDPRRLPPSVDEEVEVIEEPESEFVELPDGSLEVTLDDEEVEHEFLVNLAEVFPENILTDIATDYLELISHDKESRTKRDEQYEEGLRRTGLGKDAPGGAEFEGASTVVHPLLAEGCIDFCARAIKELMPPQGPVKTQILGKATTDKLERAERKRRFMNWQLTKGMPEYRPELEQLLTQMPLGGSQYQKFWRDADTGRPRSEFIPVDRMLLPYAASSFYAAQRRTHWLNVTRHEFKRRVKSGMWRDINNILVDPDYPEMTKTEEANAKIEGKTESAYNEDGLRGIYEIYTWESFEGDTETGGAMAPYIITIDEYSEKVLSIYRNWEQGDQYFNELQWIVEWRFLPWRGAYGIGLLHLVGGLSGAITGGLRAVLDSAHINNAPSLVKLKAARTSGQNTQVEITEITELEGPTGIDDIRKLVMAMPFNPPSTVLFQVVDWCVNQAKGVVATAEERLQDAGDRTPVGTTLAMIEQGSITYSAIHLRLHESQQKALDILCRLNREWLDYPETEELEGLGITEEDFAGNSDIVPVSDPNIFSEAQRYAQLQAVGQLIAQAPDLAWDKYAYNRRALLLLRFDGADDVLPPRKEPTFADPITENVRATSGEPIKAFEQQDHRAHMFAHLAFATSPMFGSNPIMANPTIGILVQHVKEHLVFYYQEHAKAAIAALNSIAAASEDDMEETVKEALSFADQEMAQDLDTIMQMLDAAVKAQQQFAPQPQLDPQSQVALQIGQAEVKRKETYDQGMLKLKGEEAAAKNQREQIQQSMDAQAAQFQQMLDRMGLMLEQQGQRLSAQTELLKNMQDNKQHQQTELVKNRDDNDTQERIAAGQQNANERIAAGQQQVDAGQQQVDATNALFEKVTGMLQSIQDDTMRKALEGVITELRSAQTAKDTPVSN